LDQLTISNKSDIKFNLPRFHLFLLLLPSPSHYLTALGSLRFSQCNTNPHKRRCFVQFILRLMNPFTISHRLPMLSSPSPPPPLSTATSAPSGGACSGSIHRLDICLVRSAPWARSWKIKTRGGAESSSALSTRRKFGRKALLTSDMGAGEEVGSRPLLQVQSGEG
jgi:hypothetical protein